MIDSSRSKNVLRVAALAALAILVCQISTGQQSPPENWTAEQDHQNMMDQLGIKALRPGPSGNEKDPNHALHGFLGDLTADAFVEASA